MIIPPFPSDTLIDKARELANLKGRSIYLFKQHDEWHISEELGTIASEQEILEIKPDVNNQEIDNTGGC